MKAMRAPLCIAGGLAAVFGVPHAGAEPAPDRPEPPGATDAGAASDGAPDEEPKGGEARAPANASGGDETQAADPAGKGGAEEAEGGSLSVAFSGGLMIPRASLAEARSPGLTAGLLVAYTGESGLGLSAAAEYAPLPRQRGGDPSSAARESHVASATLAPRFTLGRGSLRAWVAAGGGVVFDYESLERPGSGDANEEFSYEPVASGALGLELHAFDSGGFLFKTHYRRSLTRSEPRYELMTWTGGLLLEF